MTGGVILTWNDDCTAVSCNRCNWNLHNIRGPEQIAEAQRACLAHLQRHHEEQAMPEDQSPLVESAVTMHEMFVSWMEAGFSEDQALKLLAHLIAMNTGGDDAS